MSIRLPNFPIVDALPAIIWDHDLRPEERLARLDDARLQLVELAVPSQADSNEKKLQRWQAAEWLACMPSLQTIASDEDHSASVARSVTSNLQEHAKDVLIDETLRFADKEGYKTATSGYISELAIFGVLWWSSASDFGRARTFSLPATTVEDKGGVLNGHRTGFDISVYDPAEIVQSVQVKRTDEDQAGDGKTKLPYASYITIASPKKLVDDRPQLADLLLLDAFVDGNSAKLSVAADRLHKAMKYTRQQQFASAFELGQLLRT